MSHCKILKVLILAGTVLLLAAGVAAPAQAQLSAFGGVSFPTGKFGDLAGTGWQLGAAYDFSLLPIVSIGAWGAYNRFGLDNADGNYNSWELLARGKLNLPITGLYGWLGLGLSNSKLSNKNLDTDRETDFTWALGGGWKMTLIDINLTYHQIGTEETTSNYFTLGAGVSF